MPEIILSDVMFPQENGCDLGERIFEMNPNAKIVMISAYDDFDNARRALRFRAVDYLLKPVSREQRAALKDTASGVRVLSNGSIIRVQIIGRASRIFPRSSC